MNPSALLLFVFALFSEDLNQPSVQLFLIKFVLVWLFLPVGKHVPGRVLDIRGIHGLRRRHLILWLVHPRVLKWHHALGFDDLDASAHSGVDATLICEDSQILEVEAEGVVVVSLSGKF